MLEQFREKQSELTTILDQIGDVAREVGATSLAGRVAADIARKLEADRFHLVVVGEFNHGKSQFVNSLLGEAVLPVGVTPTTTAIHHLVYGEEPRAEVVLAGGERREIDYASVRSYAIGGEHADEAISYVEVAYPAELLKERIVLVDTPGVNDLSLTRAEITYGYIPRADAVLFVLDAGQPVKESERVFLETQLFGRSRDRIVFVVAKADIWSESEKAEALAYIRDRLRGLVQVPVVFPVSAHAHLAGRHEESGIAPLVGHLTRFLAEERGSIVLRNAVGEGLAAASVLGRGIEARRRAASMSAGQLSRRIQLLEDDLAGHADALEKRRLSIREETAAVKAWARRDLDRFCDDVVLELPTMVAQASGQDLKQHLGAFLERRFRDWAEAESREITTSLEQLADRMAALVRDDAQEVGKRVSDALGTSLEAPSIEVDTFAYDVGIFAVFSLGMGMLFANALLGVVLLAAAPALALWNRDRTEAEVRRRARELAPVVLREAAGKVAPKIDQMVNEFAERLDGWIVTASQELHREIIEVLEQVKKDREAGAVASESEIEACERGASRLAELVASLNRINATLPGGAGEDERP